MNERYSGMEFPEAEIMPEKLPENRFDEIHDAMKNPPLPVEVSQSSQIVQKLKEMPWPEDGDKEDKSSEESYKYLDAIGVELSGHGKASSESDQPLDAIGSRL